MDLKYIKSRIENRRSKPLGIVQDYAVLLPLIYINEELHILFETRSNKLDTQPGEISFPGGRVENGESFKEAAIRETVEELNIDRQKINIIGDLDYIVMPFNISIYAFAGIINDVDISKIEFNNNEVEKVFTVPLSYFVNNNPLLHYLYIRPKTNDDFPYHMIENGKAYNWRTGKYPVYFYEYGDYIIWGITARIIKNFIDILKD